MADDQEDARRREQAHQAHQAQEVQEEQEQKKTPRWPWVVAGLIAVAFVVGVALILFLPHREVKTDDAYVTAHYATVAPRVSGQVTAVLVNDNQPVRAGDPLVQIDERDYQAALHQAQAALAGDRAQVEQAQAQVSRQPAIIRQAAAQVDAARARLILSEQNARRYTNLDLTGAGTTQARQQADAQLRQDQASLESADADLTSARRQLDALRANRKTAEARVSADRATVEQARLNLSYTRLNAPITGTVDQRSVQVGNIVAPGAATMIVVPLEAVYIEANYREVALRRMRPGQPVRIHVDAYDVWLDGVVQSLPASSGAALSPIPLNNATGNFTKIVQRLPVKITVRPGQPLARLLRMGMSVETVVDTGLETVVAAERRPGADGGPR